MLCQTKTFEMPVLYMNLREFIVGTLDEWELVKWTWILPLFGMLPPLSNGGHPDSFIFFVYKVICDESLYLMVTASHGSPKLQVYADNPVQWFHDIRQLLDVVFQISLSNSFRRSAENNHVLPDSTRKFNGKKSCPPQIVARNVERFWNTLMIWWRLARGVSTPETMILFACLLFLRTGNIGTKMSLISHSHLVLAMSLIEGYGHLWDGWLSLPKPSVSEGQHWCTSTRWFSGPWTLPSFPTRRSFSSLQNPHFFSANLVWWKWFLHRREKKVQGLLYSVFFLEGWWILIPGFPFVQYFQVL